MKSQILTRNDDFGEGKITRQYRARRSGGARRIAGSCRSDIWDCFNQGRQLYKVYKVEIPSRRDSHCDFRQHLCSRRCLWDSRSTAAEVNLQGPVGFLAM